MIWRDDPGGGADIGAGLVAFGFLVVAGLVWALLDGRRYDLGGVIACWFVVGALLGVLMWLSIVVREDVPLFHDVFFIPFLAFQVGVPAALGAAIGRALRR